MIRESSRLQRFHFHRFEFKYLLAPAQAAEIYRELSFHMDPDPFARDHPGKSYRVTSLYFDTDALDHYYEKLDGLRSRKKIRIRTYAEGPEEELVIYLEIKRRKNNTIIKDRVDLPYEAICHPRMNRLFSFLEDPVLPRDRKRTLEEFLFDFYRLRLTPQVRVTYLRKPLVARINPKIRVTFDSSVRSAATDRLFSPEAGRFVFPQEVVMEIKFSGSLPWWLHHVIQKYELTQESLSKYCLGVEQCGRLEGIHKWVGYRRDYARRALLSEGGVIHR